MALWTFYSLLYLSVLLQWYKHLIFWVNVDEGCYLLWNCTNLNFNFILLFQLNSINFNLLLKFKLWHIGSVSDSGANHSGGTGSNPAVTTENLLNNFTVTIGKDKNSRLSGVRYFAVQTSPKFNILPFYNGFLCWAGLWSLWQWRRCLKVCRWVGLCGRLTLAALSPSPTI